MKSIELKIQHYSIEETSGTKGISIIIPKPNDMNLINTLDYYSLKDNSHSYSHLLYKSDNWHYKEIVPPNSYIFYNNIYTMAATKGILKSLKKTIKLFNEDPFYLDDLITHLKALSNYINFD